MQKRNREINVFSMSAIDLFCSGMGAIMVLMVILMPSYMKNQRIDNLEIAFVVDRSASMESLIETLRNALTGIAQTFPEITDHVRVGFVFYTGSDSPLETMELREIDKENPNGVDRITPEDLIAELEQIETINGGGDGFAEEDLHGAMMEVLDDSKMGWNESNRMMDQKQIVIMLGEYACYNESENSEVLDECASWSRGGKENQRAVTTALVGSAEAVDFYRECAEEGNGIFMGASMDLTSAVFQTLKHLQDQ